MVLLSHVLPLSLPEMSGVRVKCAAAWGLPHPVPGLGAAVACQVGAGGMGSCTKATKLKGREILHLGRNWGPLLLVPGHGMLQFFIGVPFLDNSSVAGSGAAPQEEPCPWASRRLKLMLLMEVCLCPFLWHLLDQMWGITTQFPPPHARILLITWRRLSRGPRWPRTGNTGPKRRLREMGLLSPTGTGADEARLLERCMGERGETASKNGKRGAVGVARHSPGDSQVLGWGLESWWGLWGFSRIEALYKRV